MRSGITRRWRRLVAIGAFTLLVSGLFAPGSAGAADVGICVIGVPSPCNAPQYWYSPPRNPSPISLPAPVLPRYPGSFR